MSIFKDETFIPRRRPEVFDFFSNAENLEALTPKWLKFVILTPCPIAMRKGAQIDYRLKIRGFPLTWRTEIAEWDPPVRFVDVQLKGPYRRWIHEHRFEDREGGTLMTDIVNYLVPGGWLVDRLFVRADVHRIFRFRKEVLLTRFGSRSP